MESPEHHPEGLNAEQASEDLDDETGPADTDETEMTGSAEPGTIATPEGTPEVSE
jgi:hypothetical protein